MVDDGSRSAHAESLRFQLLAVSNRAAAAAAAVQTFPPDNLNSSYLHRSAHYYIVVL